MNIKTGERIRNLRIKSNITQEKLANHLGVSVQAVSRWESGICYPDLELIPAIAIYFGVTTDHLLCAELETIKPIEEKYKEEWTRAFKNAEHERALDIVNEALLSVPSNYEFMLLKVTSLSALLEKSCGTNSIAETNKIIGLINDILYTILTECNIESIRCEARAWQIMIEARFLNQNGVLELAEGLPKIVYTRNALLYRYSCNEADKQRYCREHIFELLFEFVHCSKKLSENPCTTIEERQVILESVLLLVNNFIKDEHCGEFEYILDDIYEELYRITGEDKYKNEIGLHSKKYRELPEQYIYNSTLVKGCVFDHKNAIHSTDGSLK